MGCMGPRAWPSPVWVTPVCAKGSFPAKPVFPEGANLFTRPCVAGTTALPTSRLLSVPGHPAIVNSGGLVSGLPGAQAQCLAQARGATAQRASLSIKNVTSTLDPSSQRTAEAQHTCLDN